MNRRSFGATVLGWSAAMCGLPQLKATSGITVHGPEMIESDRLPCSSMTVEKGRAVVLPAGYSIAFAQESMITLRFEHVLVASEVNLNKRLQSCFGVVNKRRWCSAPAGSLMFTYYGCYWPKNGLYRVICGFTSANTIKSYSCSYRPVDFETEILKALVVR